MRLRSYPSGKTVDKKRCTHCDDEDNNDTDDKVFDHISRIDFFLVLVCDCNLNSYESTPHDNYAGKCHYDIEPCQFLLKQERAE